MPQVVLFEREIPKVILDKIKKYKKVERNLYIRLSKQMKKKKLITLLAAMTIAITSTVAVMAQTQINTVSSYGKAVVCSMTCHFSLFGNDKALAMTSWEENDGYSVKTELYSKANLFSELVFIDSDTDLYSARVSGSKSGVWEFESKHYTLQDGTTSSVPACELTDW